RGVCGPVPPRRGGQGHHHGHRQHHALLCAGPVVGCADGRRQDAADVHCRPPRARRAVRRTECVCKAPDQPDGNQLAAVSAAAMALYVFRRDHGPRAGPQCGQRAGGDQGVLSGSGGAGLLPAPIVL
ncbi:hypothetical protein H4R23_005919, partial [Coemansia sp. Cherry 401B]